MKVSTFQPAEPDVPVFFNLDASVGRNGSNSNFEDILLVQFLLKKNGELVPAGSPESKQEQEIMKRVPQTGKVDEATIDGIMAFQRVMKRIRPGTIVDGRASPASSYRYGGGMFTIVALNGFIRQNAKRTWPRLQDFADCPPKLKLKVAQVL